MWYLRKAFNDYLLLDEESIFTFSRSQVNTGSDPLYVGEIVR